MAPNLQVLSDRLAIHDVLTRYFHAVDHGSLSELESCFTADITAIYDGVEIAKDRAGLMTFFGGKRDALKLDFKMFKHRMHFIGNVTVTFSTDGTAATETYALAHLVDQPQEDLRLSTRALRYFDKLRLENGEWRIFHRRHVPQWSKTERVDLLTTDIWRGWQ